MASLVPANNPLSGINMQSALAINPVQQVSVPNAIDKGIDSANRQALNRQNMDINNQTLETNAFNQRQAQGLSSALQSANTIEDYAAAFSRHGDPAAGQELLQAAATFETEKTVALNESLNEAGKMLAGAETPEQRAAIFQEIARQNPALGKKLGSPDSPLSQGIISINREDPVLDTFTRTNADGTRQRVVQPKVEGVTDQGMAAKGISIGADGEVTIGGFGNALSGDFLKAASKVDATDVSNAREASDEAGKINNLLSALERQLTGEGSLDTGALARMKANFSAYSAEFGLGDGKIAEDSEFFESISKELGARMLQLFGGSDTERELMVALETNPTLNKRPEANRRIITRKIAALNVLSQAPVFMERWLVENGSLSKPNSEGRTFTEEWLPVQNKMFNESLRPSDRDSSSTSYVPSELGVPGFEVQGVAPSDPEMDSLRERFK